MLGMSVGLLLGYCLVSCPECTSTVLKIRCLETPHFLAKGCRGFYIHREGVKLHSAGAKLHSTGLLLTS